MMTEEQLQSVIDYFVVEQNKKDKFRLHYYSDIKISLIDMFSEFQKTMLPKPFHEFKMLTVTAKQHEEDPYYWSEITLFHLYNYSTEQDLLKKLNEYNW